MVWSEVQLAGKFPEDRKIDGIGLNGNGMDCNGLMERTSKPKNETTPSGSPGLRSTRTGAQLG